MIALHAAFAIGAAILGAYILLTRKGTARHKAIGRVFGGLMLVVAASSMPSKKSVRGIIRRFIC